MLTLSLIKDTFSLTLKLVVSSDWMAVLNSDALHCKKRL